LAPHHCDFHQHSNYVLGIAEFFLADKGTIRVHERLRKRTHHKSRNPYVSKPLLGGGRIRSILYSSSAREITMAMPYPDSFPPCPGARGALFSCVYVCVCVCVYVCVCVNV